jgi:hypothetical protein
MSVRTSSWLQPNVVVRGDSRARKDLLCPRAERRLRSKINQKFKCHSTSGTDGAHRQSMPNLEDAVLICGAGLAGVHFLKPSTQMLSFRGVSSSFP